MELRETAAALLAGTVSMGMHQCPSVPLARLRPRQPPACRRGPVRAGPRSLQAAVIALLMAGMALGARPGGKVPHRRLPLPGACAVPPAGYTVTAAKDCDAATDIREVAAAGIAQAAQACSGEPACRGFKLSNGPGDAGRAWLKWDVRPAACHTDNTYSCIYTRTAALSYACPAAPPNYKLIGTAKTLEYINDLAKVASSDVKALAAACEANLQCQGIELDVADPTRGRLKWYVPSTQFKDAPAGFCIYTRLSLPVKQECDQPDGGRFCTTRGYSMFRLDCDGDGKLDWACSRVGADFKPHYAAALSDQACLSPVPLRDSDYLQWGTSVDVCKGAFVATAYVSDYVRSCPTPTGLSASGFSAQPRRAVSRVAAGAWRHISEWLEVPQFSSVGDLVSRTASQCNRVAGCSAFTSDGWLVLTGDYGLAVAYDQCLYTKVPASGTICPPPSDGFLLAQPDKDRVGADLQEYSGMARLDDLYKNLGVNCYLFPACAGYKTQANGLDQSIGWIKRDVSTDVMDSRGGCLYQRDPAFSTAADKLSVHIGPGTNFRSCLATSGASVIQYPCEVLNTKPMMWAMESAGGNCFFLHSYGGLYASYDKKLQEPCLRAPDQLADWQKVTVAPCTRTAADKWCFAGSQATGYKISSGAAPSLCLDVEQGSPADGALLQVFTCNGSPAQTFYLGPVFF